MRVTFDRGVLLISINYVEPLKINETDWVRVLPFYENFLPKVRYFHVQK